MTRQRQAADVGYANAPCGKSALRKMREQWGAGNETEALRISLLAMIEGYDRLLAVMPEGSMARRLAAGSFGAAPQLARDLVAGK